MYRQCFSPCTNAVTDWPWLTQVAFHVLRLAFQIWILAILRATNRFRQRGIGQIIVDATVQGKQLRAAPGGTDGSCLP